MSGRQGRGSSSSVPLPLVIGVALLVVVALVAAAIFLPQFVPSPREATLNPPGSRPTSPVVEQGSLWEVAFTDPLIPDNPARHSGGIELRLVALLDRATKTIDVAIYDFDLQSVADAMARAVTRGVRVRMVTDTDTVENVKDARIQAAFKTVRDAGIPIVTDNRQPFMHNKFTVVDGEWVETGSWNYTDGDTYRLNNNLAIFRSRDLAANYSTEFEKMFTQRKFGASKPKGVPNPTLSIGGLRLENYFAPEDGVVPRLVEKIGQAQRRIHFLAFSFTQDAMGQAMVARKQAGVEVQGVFESNGADTQFSEFARLKAAGADVMTDGNPSFMHHKVILIDDRYTIFGSFNFSNNADKDNDENVLVVDDPQFTALFEAEFQRVLALARNPPPRRAGS